MLRIPGIDNEDVGGLSEALHSVGERLVVDVMKLDSVERFFGELTEAAGDSFGERVYGDAFAGEETTYIDLDLFARFFGFGAKACYEFSKIKIGGQYFKE